MYIMYVYICTCVFTNPVYLYCVKIYIPSMVFEDTWTCKIASSDIYGLPVYYGIHM